MLIFDLLTQHFKDYVTHVNGVYRLFEQHFDGFAGLWGVLTHIRGM